MLILLPPSETKARPTRGKPLDLDGLSFPELTDVRRRILDAVIDVSGRSDALATLDAPKGAADQVAANTELRKSPTAPAARIYTGVLFDALDHAGLDTGAKRRASRRLVVVSALFGAVGPADRIPAYRLSMGVDLPGVGKLAAAWRPVLGDALADRAGRGVIVDCRSATYAAAWKPTGAMAERTVTVSVVRDGDDGRTAVSHMAKWTRGLVARHLLEDGSDPRRPEELAEVLAPRFDVHLHDAGPGRPRRLDVVEPASA